MCRVMRQQHITVQVKSHTSRKSECKICESARYYVWYVESIGCIRYEMHWPWRKTHEVSRWNFESYVQSVKQTVRINVYTSKKLANLLTLYLLRLLRWYPFFRMSEITTLTTRSNVFFRRCHKRCKRLSTLDKAAWALTQHRRFMPGERFFSGSAHTFKVSASCEWTVWAAFATVTFSYDTSFKNKTENQ